MNTATNMVWMDLEMTGLDPHKERIIEVALIVTDKNLNQLDEPIPVSYTHLTLPTNREV